MGALAAPTGWLVTDALERDNDFCNACHLREGLPLHIEIRRHFDARPPSTLAGLHASAALASRPEAREFRCIDCHGGVGPVGRARVKLLAARDALWYALGHFEEPTSMAWPLRDEDCRQCHSHFGASADGFAKPDLHATPTFHELGVHNVELGVGCVECHSSHESDGDPGTSFLNARRVRRQCARCHPEFETP